MLHPAVGLPSQPWLLFLVVFFWCWWYLLFFVLFCLKQTMISGSGIGSRLHVLGVGKTRRLGLWAIKQDRRTSLSAEAVAQPKSQLPKRTQPLTASSSESCPMCWKSLPSAGIPQDQPQLSRGTLSTPRGESSQAALRLPVLIKQILQNVVLQEVQE